MGLRTNISDFLWSNGPSLAVGLLSASHKLGLEPKILQTLRYQSEFYSERRPFPCWWPRTPLPGNAGDLLTPLLLQGLFDVSPIYSIGREFLGVGSIIKQARPDTVVWGSGLITPEIPVAPGVTFLAVRGPLTRAALLGQGHSVPETYGDPAILLPLLYKPTNAAIQWRKGFIPHFVHHGSTNALPNDTKFINILRGSKADLRALIDEVMQCEMVFSSSLHGLIIALAYRKPVAWIRLPNHHLKGDSFKFRDFFSSIGLNGAHPINIRDARDLAALGACDTLQIDIPERLKTKLIESFHSFYEIRSDAVHPRHG